MNDFKDKKASSGFGIGVFEFQSTHGHHRFPFTLPYADRCFSAGMMRRRLLPMRTICETTGSPLIRERAKWCVSMILWSHSIVEMGIGGSGSIGGITDCRPG